MSVEGLAPEAYITEPLSSHYLRLGTMNLLDMLAGDPPEAIYTTANEVLEILEEPEMNIEPELSSKLGVHYLPTVLTALQRDICEILVQIMRHHLSSGVEYRRNRASINSLLETAEIAETGSDFDSHDMVKLLFDQLCIASRHPSLLVDHLMPKQLLLLETNERLLNLSGNLKFFNELINGIISSMRGQKGPEPLNVLVVAENVKDLELIEGIIVGKQLFYKNLSSRKLYDDKAAMPGHENNPDEPSTKKRKTRFNISVQSPRSLCMYLISTQQLYNNYTPLSVSGNASFHHIFSFDQTIDCESPSIEVLRNVHPNGHKTPVFIPVPAMSILHIISQIPKPATSLGTLVLDRALSPAHKWRLKVLNTYIVNRFNLFEQSVSGFYRENHQSLEELYGWITGTTGKYPSFGLGQYSNRLMMNFTDERLIKKVRMDYLEALTTTQGARTYNYGEEVRSYKEFKQALSKILNERIEEVTISQRHFAGELVGFRRDESRRQLEIDDDEDLIATSYREMKILVEKANVSERIAARSDGDMEKVRQKNELLQSREQILKDNIGSADEESVAKQKTHIEELKSELYNVTKELDKLDHECDESRQKYQESSATAAQTSGELSVLQEKNIKLQQKLDGPGARNLPSLFKDDTLHRIEAEIKRVQLENAFIEEMFSQKLDRIVKERNGILDSSGGSTSRLVNRISRSATPM